MVSTLLDLVAMTVSSAFGLSSTIPLGAAATIGGTTYITFESAGAVTGTPVTYSILDTNNSETGTATYSSAALTLTNRTPTKSTNGSSFINASSAAVVLASARAEDIVTSVTAGIGLSGGGAGGALTLNQASSSVRATLSSDRSLGAAITVTNGPAVTVSSAGTYFIFGTACCKSGAAGGSKFFSRISDGVTVWCNSGYANSPSSIGYINVFCFGIATNPNGGSLTLQALDGLSSQGVFVANDTGSGAAPGGDSYITAVRIG